MFSTIKEITIQHLDTIESRIQTELMAAKKRSSLTLTDDVNTFTTKQNAFVNWKSMLKGVLRHGLDHQCLITANKINEKVGYMNKEIRNNLKDIRHVDIKYNAESILAQFANNVKYFGTVKVEENTMDIKYRDMQIMDNDFHSGEIME